eukprot:TRINITY_DN3217_c0_g1_i3.p1 TRINITY_DN3217_c0_g1~~TRINITY_DN3217_c0_g1_i3.p1  ORF type:complete len:930 (-),score=208.84 TRINITY_DN3217_c0_g1_i3:490-3279(-)
MSFTSVSSTRTPQSISHTLQPPSVSVTFQVEANTKFGQTVKVVGDISTLGAWQTANAVPLHTNEKIYPLWTATVSLPLSSIVEYKYIRVGPNEPISWEETPTNRRLTVDAPSLEIHDGEFGTIPMHRDLQSEGTKSDARLNHSHKGSFDMLSIDEMGDGSSGANEKRPSIIDGERDGSVIISMYRLPIRARRNPDTKALEFSWDNDALYFTCSGLRAGLQGRVKVKWVGIIDDIIIPVEEQEQAAQILSEKFNCIPVWVGEDLRRIHYVGFCKEILWPLFHHVVELKEKTTPFDADMWKGYCLVNNMFAQKIMEIYKEGDLIWIHDYHLLLLPSYLRRRMSLYRASIGLFLHTPFPSSEVYRLLPVRVELLHGLLSATLIGFQMFEYARHFLTCCKRLLGLEFDSRRGGFLGIEYNGQQVMVRVTHIGIDPSLFGQAKKRDEVVQYSQQLSHKLKGCTVLSGVDTLERLKGVGLKLLAIEALLRDYPRYREKLVLIQVCIPRYLSLECDPMSMELKEHVERINQTYGNPETGYMPIIYIEKDISFEERVSIYCVSDGVLVTSVRDGLNLVPYEYIVSATDKKGITIVSEFTGCSRSLSGAIRINPWSTDDLASAIDKAFSMNDVERQVKYDKDYEYITKHSTTFWALNFLRDLEKVTTTSTSATYLGLGLGLGFRVLEYGADFKRLEFAKVVKAYQQSRRRIIFLDYEGTLCANHTSLINVNRPDEDVLNNLEFLCSDPKNNVIIISGRQRSTMEEWFQDVERLGIAAEHGFFYKNPSSQGWSQLEPDADFSWMEPAAAICDIYTERTDGATLEIKETSLVWRYRDCDPEFGALQAKELCAHLEEILSSYDIQIQHGKGLLEVKPHGINKGVAVERILQEVGSKDGSSQDFIMAIGDDRSDEDMFAFLRARFPHSSSVSFIANNHVLYF